MEVLIWGLAIFGSYMLWKKLIRPLLFGRMIPSPIDRGLLAVKAAAYLIMLEGGKEPDEINATVGGYNENMDTILILTAKEFIQERYNGKQLPMIAEARVKGFRD